MPAYQSAILAELARSRFADHEGNYDHALGKEPPPPPTVVRECLAEARERAKEARRALAAAWEPVGRALEYSLTPGRYFSKRAAAQIAQGEFLYPRLADERSRRLLLKLIAFKVMGHRRVKLPRNTPEHWAALDRMRQYATDAPPVKIKFMDASLAVYDTRPLGYDMRVHAMGTGLAYALCQKQYEYHNGDVHVKAEPGEVVIDAGGCWGETTMYFAHEVGPTGVCVAYEFIPSNLDVLKRNVGLNPHLKDRLRLVERPIWSSTGKPLFFVDWGPGSRVSADPRDYGGRPDGKTTTITIDDTLRALKLPKVDFIKMDIEGAELEALRGAEASIRRHRPKLAISLYHRAEDFTEIPRYIESLGLGYKFYLEHHTLYQNETVLFCVPQPRRIDAAYTLHVQGRHAEAEARYRQIIESDPGSAEAADARNNLYALYQEAQRWADAADVARAAFGVQPADETWRRRLALSLLRDGRHAEAWPLYADRPAPRREAGSTPRISFPEWRGEAVESVLIWPESDMADVIGLSRYLPTIRARGIRVVLACRANMADVLAPLADEVVVLQGATVIPAVSAWAMMGALPDIAERESSPAAIA